MKKLCFIMSVILLVCIFSAAASTDEKKDFIKWVDLNATREIMDKALELDKETKSGAIHVPFYKTLAFVALKNSNRFSLNKDIKIFNSLKEEIEKGNTPDSLYGENKYYKYYCNAYSLIFENFVGSYVSSSGDAAYGLKVYHPISKGFYFAESDDFGNGRNYGFKRKHLGHDIFAITGTPVIAVEDGIVSELGWNRYGGWRIGISSGGGKRYYYYAHLRQNAPFHSSVEKGKSVRAGQVIGYVGRTGYSFTENKNMNVKSHLHFGMQLIFDDSQRNGKSEIWIDVYQICRFLYKMRAQTVKDPQSGEYNSVNLIK